MALKIAYEIGVKSRPSQHEGGSPHGSPRSKTVPYPPIYRAEVQPLRSCTVQLSITFMMLYTGDVSFLVLYFSVYDSKALRD